MNQLNTNTIQKSLRKHSLFSALKSFVFVLICFKSIVLLSQHIPNEGKVRNEDEERLLKQYIQTIDNSSIIFDSSNIKQFWINKTVMSQDQEIVVMTEETSNDYSSESEYLKIQLANVNASQDCKITIITEADDIDWTIANNDKKALPCTKDETSFIKYKVKSSLFHLADAPGMCFYIKIKSKNKQSVSIKKIILSFSKNDKFLFPPGKLTITKDNLLLNRDASVASAEDASIVIKGKMSEVFSDNKIVTADNVVSLSAKIKNVGETDTTVYLGYAIYTQDGFLLDRGSFPYTSGNNLLKVISSTGGKDKIIVDSYSDWRKGNRLAIDAKDDMSDVPTTNLLDGKIIEVRKIDEKHTEISLDKPLNSALAIGTNVRIHGPNGAFLYTNIKTFKPCEEIVLNSSIQKDDSFLEYSPKALSRGVFFIVPLLLSYSVDSSQQNTISITDFSVTY